MSFARYVVRTVANRLVLGSLVKRLQELRPDTPRRWGTMTPHEMLCHLGDAGEMVLRIRPREESLPRRRRPFFKSVALWSPLRGPRGMPTNPMHDPKAKGTRPSVFAQDLARAVATLEEIAAAKPGTLEPTHGLFGDMSVADWQRWAYKHTDHHLRQFGL